MTDSQFDLFMKKQDRLIEILEAIAQDMTEMNDAIADDLDE